MRWTTSTPTTTTSSASCTFCYYHMIEYGVRDPDVMVGGRSAASRSPTSPTCGAPSPRPASGSPSIPSSPRTRSGARCAAGTARTSTTRPTSWWRRSSAATARARPASTTSLENGVYSFQYHPGAGPRSLGQRRQGHARLPALLHQPRRAPAPTGSPRKRELYQRMADYEALIFETRDGGREVTVGNPTSRRITGDGDRAAPAVRQRLGRGDEELIHVARGAFVTIPPLRPGRRGDAPLQPPRSRTPCWSGSRATRA